ncbi:helix-turn-helix domain-containing protein [Ktedonobacter robiniae]|uniref:Helix-turn-helix domain-containing protein n=1 Tax=Ktedonobacter robiniae TaxID=2778365 RepID=A0ABQ3UPV7_9CHLR|nr:helix-turn-helix domain-containing protein [Ktedonobacter robiniae]GHO54799.1 hypothetical protein KSB_32740 [Ktedonobacter robiniae]
MQKSIRKASGELQPLLTIPDVAKTLNVCERMVYKLIDYEGLPTISLGRSVRINPVSLKQWLADRENKR